MSSASSSSRDVALIPNKKARLDPATTRQLVAEERETKTALANTLMKLKKQGLLEAGATRRELRDAAEHHAKQNTPYGKVVQKVELGLPNLKYLDVVNPFAFLAYVTSISSAFAAMMKDCCRPGVPLRLVIFADEMNPGNPFRPEKGRLLQCVYWAFVDWPAHVLSRSFAWPVLCVIRSTIIHKISGGMSYIARLLLRMFFPETGHSLERGVMLNLPGGDSILVTAVFAGFLCDLKGHKEVTEWKGTGGNVCCITCANIDSRLSGDTDDVHGLDCFDYRKFKKRSNVDVYTLFDELTARCHGQSKRQIEKLQTEYGFNLCPNGILADRSLRSLFKPVDHCIRDWMHVMVGDGVANSVLGMLFFWLKFFKYPIDSVRDFMMQCNLPSKYGKANREWLKDYRIKAKTLSSFAGIVLTLVPMMYLFFLSFCQDDARLKKQFKCIELLHHICGIMATGTDKPMAYVDHLREMCLQLHKLYGELSTSFKPKIHHMHHIFDSMVWLGKLLSCFVTERKHRQVKDAALHVYRHMEHTVLVDIVNKCCDQIASGHDVFEKRFLVNPRECKLQPEYLTSTRAVLECGPVRNGDVLVFKEPNMRNCTCGMVAGFYIISEVLFVEIRLLPVVDEADISLRSNTCEETSFKECRFVVDACMWHSTERAGIIRVCWPPILLFDR